LRVHAPALDKARALCLDAATAGKVVSLRIEAQTLVDDAERIVWLAHRLAKLLHGMALPTAQNVV
jgi:hypothetical protein